MYEVSNAWISWGIREWNTALYDSEEARLKRMKLNAYLEIANNISEGIERSRIVTLFIIDYENGDYFEKDGDSFEFESVKSKLHIFFTQSI